MGLASIVKEHWLGRKRKVTYADPARTIVFSHDRKAFLHWCRSNGILPNDPTVISIVTSKSAATRIIGYRFRPKDTFVVLEIASFGHGWKDICREVLYRTEGWVDLNERKEHFI